MTILPNILNSEGLQVVFFLEKIKTFFKYVYCFEFDVMFSPLAAINYQYIK